MTKNKKKECPFDLLGLLLCVNIELGKDANKLIVTNHDRLLIDVNMAINELLTAGSNVSIY